MSAVLVKQFLNSDCGIHFESVGEARNLWKNQKNQIINFEANKHSRSLWEKQKKTNFSTPKPKNLAKTNDKTKKQKKQNFSTPKTKKLTQKQWENQKNQKKQISLH